MNAWFNYEATLKILFFSLMAGAALPGLFAVGIRLQAAGAGATGTGSGQQKPLLVALAWVIYALVVTVVLVGVLFIARDFIAHHTHYPFLGAKP